MQGSAVSDSPLVSEAQVAPAALLGCVHTPPPQTSPVQSFVPGVHAPEVLLAWHTPLPLQVSGLSHSPLVGEPQVAPAALFGCVHTPPPQTSFVQSLVSGVHAPEMLLAWHTPLPLQVSGLSHSPLVCEPQVAPAALFGCVHTPPPQTSFVQSLVSGVHAPEMLLAWHTPLPLH